MSDYIIGLTGGIASGKSLVGARFAALGVTLVDADVAARAVLAPGSEGLAEVTASFGADVLDAQGMLDRASMRARVFADPQLRRQLEAIVHPRVRAILRDAAAAAVGPYAIAMIPLLAEGGGRAAYPWLDRILVVDAPVDVQVARLVQRDGIDVALAERMLAAQATRRDRLAIADDILVNDGNVAALDVPIRELDRQYRVLASASEASA